MRLVTQGLQKSVLSRFMNWRLWFYDFARHQRLKSLLGGWRIHAVGKLMVTDRYFKVDYQEGKVWICPVQSLGRAVFENGEWEPELTAVIRFYMAHGYTFVDVGANIGLHTLTAAWSRRSNQQPILAFEPEAHCFEMLSKNLELNGICDVEAYNIGLGDQEEQLLLHISTTGNKGNHSFLNRENTKPGMPVQIRKLDDMVGDRDWSQSHVLVKIDVEGFEPHVLRGGLRWLRALKHAAVVCELFPDLLIKQNLSPLTVSDILREAGFYDSFRVIDYKAEAEGSKFWNQLYVKGDAARITDDPIACSLARVALHRSRSGSSCL